MEDPSRHEAEPYSAPACGGGRDVATGQEIRLARGTLDFMAEDTTEIFDDLYLGLRAGGRFASSVAASR